MVDRARFPGSLSTATVLGWISFLRGGECGCSGVGSAERAGWWFSAHFIMWYDNRRNLRTFGTAEPRWANPPADDIYREEIQLAELNNVSPVPTWLTQR